MFKGSIVALVTPFTNGKVDKNKLRNLVEFQIKNGTSGIVSRGTTGESPTLDNEEHIEVIKILCGGDPKESSPSLPELDRNSTAEAIALTSTRGKK